MKNIFLTLCLITTLWGVESFNYIDQNYAITSEKELKKNYFPIISPYYYKHKIHYFQSYDNLSIAYKIFQVKNAKANIVISSGRTEGMLKYQELIYDLNRNGYSVYILDHRGQGNSQRILADSQLGHVNEFDDYVKDFHQFVTAYLPKNEKRVLMAHSMGGAIASLYVEEYPKDFNALVLSSPMHQPNLGGKALTGFVCELIEKRQRNIDKYIIGEKSYDASQVDFSENILTHSKIRYEIMKLAYDIEPKTKVGGPSVRWVAEACDSSAKSVQNASKILIPTLLLQAQNDEVVNKQAQDEFCKGVGTLCQEYQIDGAYHELFIEKDSIRGKALSAILNFIAKI
jgi:lysophospholipase